MAQRVYQVLVLILFIAIILLISSCEDEGIIIGHKSYSFSGLVADSISSSGIDSASISIEDTLGRLKFYSDSSGFYAGSSYAGSVTLFVQKLGYMTQSRNILLNKNLDSINFRLVPDSI